MKAEKECKEDKEFMEKRIQMEHQTFQDKLKNGEENHIQTKREMQREYKCREIELTVDKILGSR